MQSPCQHRLLTWLLRCCWLVAAVAPSRRAGSDKPKPRQRYSLFVACRHPSCRLLLITKESTAKQCREHQTGQCACMALLGSSVCLVSSSTEQSLGQQQSAHLAVMMLLACGRCCASLQSRQHQAWAQAALQPALWLAGFAAHQERVSAGESLNTVLQVHNCLHDPLHSNRHDLHSKLLPACLATFQAELFIICTVALPLRATQAGSKSGDARSQQVQIFRNL